MITRDLDAFSRYARSLPADFGPACPRAVFLVTPEGFSLAAQSAQDNRYMAMQAEVQAERALAQHRALQAAISAQLPCLSFAGDPAAPDGVFPNNVFASVRGRLLLGHMRHPVRQREAERADIRGFFTDLLGYALVDLRQQAGICELTGSLIIDRTRGIGYCGLSERCDAAGAAAMHAAFGLRATLLFDLAPGEYHSNVVMSVLAGRGLVICPEGFADAAVPAAISALYAPDVVQLSAAQKAAFTGNCIALDAHTVWMSAVAAASLDAAQRRQFAAMGFAVQAVALDEIEKAGGSLRCCVAEVY